MKIYPLLLLLLLVLLLATVLEAQDTPSEPAPFLDSQALVAQATEAFKTTGMAPVLRDGVLLRFPFGATEPSLNCGPTAFCDLELEAGEVILGIAAADPSWIAERLVSGSAASTTPHIVLKPSEWGAPSSALLITTNRRSYHLQLTADRRLPINSYSAFYYPRDLIRFEATELAARRAEADREDTATVASVPDLAKLDCDYRIRGKQAPVLACADGVRTYLFWGSRRHEAPAIFAIDEQGERILNHRVKGSWYILDTVAPRFELRVGRQTAVVTRSRQQ